MSLQYPLAAISLIFSSTWYKAFHSKKIPACGKIAEYLLEPIADTIAYSTALEHLSILLVYLTELLVNVFYKTS